MRALGIFTLGLACAAGCAADPGVRRPRAEQTDSGSAVFERAREAAHRGDTIRAEQYFAAALDAGYPADAIVPELVRVCVESSRLRTALRYAEPYVRRHPEAVPLRLVLATLYLGLGWDAAAVSELSGILRIRPEHAIAHFLLGVHEISRGHDAGYGHLRRYLALEPEGTHAAEAKDTLERRSMQLAAGPGRSDE